MIRTEYYAAALVLLIGVLVGFPGGWVWALAAAYVLFVVRVLDSSLSDYRFLRWFESLGNGSTALIDGETYTKEIGYWTDRERSVLRDDDEMIALGRAAREASFHAAPRRGAIARRDENEDTP